MHVSPIRDSIKSIPPNHRMGVTNKSKYVSSLSPLSISPPILHARIVHSSVGRIAVRGRWSSHTTDIERVPAKVLVNSESATGWRWCPSTEHGIVWARTAHRSTHSGSHRRQWRQRLPPARRRSKVPSTHWWHSRGVPALKHLVLISAIVVVVGILNREWIQ